MISRLHISAFLISAAAAMVTQAQAQETTKPAQPPKGPRVVKLTLEPAAAPDPALKYLLTPDFADQTPGNAALIFDTAAQLATDAAKDKDFEHLYDKVSDWLHGPVEQLDQKEVNKALDRAASALRYAELASRREWCEWETPVRSEGFSALLPSLASLRFVVRLLALRISLALSEGRYDDALIDLQTGFGTARHIGGGPTLIQNLVGAATAALMSRQVEQWTTGHASPNLYWALADLPRPFIDSRRALQIERCCLFYEAPQLRNLQTRALTPQELDALIDKLIGLLVVLCDESRFEESASESWKDREAAKAAMASSYPKAKEYLATHGRTREQIEAMPAEQVVILYSLERFLHWRDEEFKWFGLPFWQAHNGLVRFNRELERAYKQDPAGGYPFIDLLPSLSRAYLLLTKVDREIAACQCIEAIRIYAAGHEDKLPASLADITQVPVPLDPVTGKPFVYEFAGDQATLVGTVPPDQPVRDGVRYELTMAKTPRASK